LPFFNGVSAVRGRLDARESLSTRCLYRPRPPRAREIIEREKAVAFDALAAMPNAFLGSPPGRPMPGFFTAAFAFAAAAFASRFAFRSARTLSAAVSASACSGFGFGGDFGFLAIVRSGLGVGWVL
jgi:hypothetical protein